MLFCHMVLFQVVHNFACTQYDRLRHPRYLCHMNTEAVLAATRFQFTQKYHFVVHFLYGNIEVFDARKVVSKLI
ncbi:hypothetical protein D3C87_2106590 [compost metagenome]